MVIFTFSSLMKISLHLVVNVAHRKVWLSTMLMGWIEGSQTDVLSDTAVCSSSKGSSLSVPPVCRGRREPGIMTLQRGRIFGLVLFKRNVTDQEGRPAGQRLLGR